jgi:hypothetical protein
MVTTREVRQPYEFSIAQKRDIRKSQKNKCAITGEKTLLEIHHLLPICLAHGFFPTVNPAIFKQEENMIGLSHDVHEELHLQMREWPPEFTRLFVIGLYSYLRDIYNEKQAKIERDKALLGSGGRRRI